MASLVPNGSDDNLSVSNTKTKGNTTAMTLTNMFLGPEKTAGDCQSSHGCENESEAKATRGKACGEKS